MKNVWNSIYSAYVVASVSTDEIELIRETVYGLRCLENATSMQISLYSEQEKLHAGPMTEAEPTPTKLAAVARGQMASKIEWEHDLLPVCGYHSLVHHAF